MELIVFYAFIFIFGLIIGSFLNCVIYRLARPNFSLWKNLGGLKGRSYCPHCKNRLIWLDLIPIFSFLFLKGKCRYCHKKISIQYPIVEILTGLIFLLIFNHSAGRFALVLGQNAQIFEHFGFSVLNLLFLFYISSVLIIIFIYDLKYYLIPDKVLFPTIAIALLYRLFYFSLIWDYLLAVLIASGFFLFIFLISKGRWMGFGDVKLAILLGLFLGFPNILVGLFLSFFFGAIIGLALIILNLPAQAGKIGLKSEIPFAPFLITGTFIAMFFGDIIIQWYLSLFLF